MGRRGWPAWTTIFLLLSATLVLGACARPAASQLTSGADGNGSASPSSAPLRTPTSRILEAYGRLPLHFEENQGQADRSVRFLARAEGGPISLTSEGLVLGLDGGNVGLTFVDAASAARLEALDPLAGRVNYYLGRDRSEWRTGIPTYARVRYEGVYPGVDVVVYGNRRLEYDFVVAPGADPGAIRVRVDGADALELSDGDLVIRRSEQTIVQQAPVIYQERSGRRELVKGRYVLRGRDVTFAVDAYDRSRPLVIDPVIVYIANVGPGTAYVIAVDANGSAIIAGVAGGGSGYPQVNPAFGPKHCCLPDMVVTKLTPNGDALVYSTFIGTTFGSDVPSGIAVDSAGNAWVSGTVAGNGLASPCDWPTTPDAVMPSWCGDDTSGAGVVAKFSPTGSLLYSTYLAGEGTGSYVDPDGGCIQTRLGGIALDAADNAYVVGRTTTTDYPTTPGAYQTARAPRADNDYCHGSASAAVVTKLTSAGALAYSTFLDSGRNDNLTAVAVDAFGNVYAGGTGNPFGTNTTPPFPVTANLTASGTQQGGYVVKLNATGFPTQGTIIGPTPKSIDVGADGSAYVAGSVPGPEFVTVNAFQPTPPGSTDGFAARIHPAGTAYMWSTYVGGAEEDDIDGIALDAGGNAWLVGSSNSANFPMKDPIQPKKSLKEAMVVQLSPTGTLLFGSPVTASTGVGIALDLATNVYLTGHGGPTFAPTPGAYDHGSGSLFVAKLAPGSSGGGAQPVVWTSPVKVAVDGNTITKTSGCEGCADAGAVSQQTIASGDGFVEFTVSPNAYLTVGLSNGNPGTSSSEVKFGLRFFPGAVQARESGVYQAGWSQVAGAVYKVAVEGGVVTYYENGVLKYTSTLAPTYPLLVDTALLTLNAGVQNAVISTGSGGGGTPPPDPTPPTVAITAPGNGATVSGPTTVTATASDNVGVSDVQFELDGVNLGAADTTAPYSVAWDTTTATNGPHTLTAVAKDAAGNTTVSEPITVTVSNDTPPPGPGPQPVVWTSAVKVAVSGNTITKNAGCDGCADAGAVSQQMITSGTGYVEFTVSSGATLTVGLSTGNPGTSGSEIKFGLRFYPGSPGIVEVREGGVYKWDWQHIAGAVYKVAVDAGVVKYYQNGALKYTSALAPTYPLLVDTAILSVGASVQNATIGP